jgi:hypothetical protein
LLANRPGQTLIGAITLAAAILLAFFWWTYRNSQIDRLEEAAGGLHGTDPAMDAIRALREYRGSRVTDVLRRIATGRGPVPFVTTEMRVEAIVGLSERAQPRNAEEIARLLQPFESDRIRLASARAVEAIGCEPRCLVHVLAYLERIHEGSLNIEDKIVQIGEGAAEIKELHLRQQKEIYAILYRVVEHSEDAHRILIEIYGLRSNAPSRFALDLLQRVRLPTVCRDLTELDLGSKALPSETFIFPRDEVSAAIAFQECR